MTILTPQEAMEQWKKQNQIKKEYTFIQPKLNRNFRVKFKTPSFSFEEFEMLTQQVNGVSIPSYNADFGLYSTNEIVTVRFRNDIRNETNLALEILKKEKSTISIDFLNPSYTPKKEFEIINNKVYAINQILEQVLMKNCLLVSIDYDELDYSNDFHHNITVSFSIETVEK